MVATACCTSAGLPLTITASSLVLIFTLCTLCIAAFSSFNASLTSGEHSTVCETCFSGKSTLLTGCAILTGEIDRCTEAGGGEGDFLMMERRLDHILLGVTEAASVVLAKEAVSSETASSWPFKLGNASSNVGVFLRAISGSLLFAAVESVSFDGVEEESVWDKVESDFFR